MKNKGFTLIELAIVMVIIGMLAGGIYVGQSLLRQAQVTSLVTDEQEYVRATIDFRDKFGQLPGDFTTATTYWGTAATCPPTYAAPLTGDVTCNGNGNGKLDYTAGYELFLYWNHLAKAKMIQGYYNGAPGAASIRHHVAGKNSPLSKLDGTIFGVMYQGTVVSDGSVNFFDGVYGHVLLVGSPSVNNIPVNGTLTATEALAIDNKLDDGKPAYGNVLTYKYGGFFQICATTAVSTTAAYAIATASRICPLVFITGF